jgi:hypothetical protein
MATRSLLGGRPVGVLGREAVLPRVGFGWELRGPD